MVPGEPASFSGCAFRGIRSDTRNTRGLVMLKILTITAASIAMLSAAAAADLPRKEPPPPAAPVGKAPIGKYPVGKAPIGKYPQPVAARG